MEQSVVEARLPALHLVVAQLHVFDLEVMDVLADAQAEATLLQQVVNVVCTTFQADDAGLFVRYLILYERITIVEPFLFVIVKEGGLPLGGFDDGGPETRHFVGEKRVGEPDL